MSHEFYFLETIQEQENDCNCSITCTRTSYEPSLSYAELSEFNIDQVALTDDTEKETVRVKFEAAMETQQRVVDTIRNTDTTQMQTFLTLARDLYTALNNTHALSSDTDALATKYKFPDILKDGDASTTTDISEAAKRAEDLDETGDGMKIAFWDTRDVLERVRDNLLGYDNGDFKAVEAIDYCIGEGLNGSEDLGVYCRPPPQPGFVCDANVEMYCFMSELTNLPKSQNGPYADGDENKARETIKAELMRRTKYEQTVTWAFAGQTLDPIKFADHYKCNTELDRYENQVLVDFLSVMDTIKTLESVSNLTTAKEIFTAIDNEVNIKLAPYLLVNDTLNIWRAPPKPSDESEEKIYDTRETKCYWYLSLLDDEVGDYTDILTASATTLKESHTDVRNKYKDIVKKLSELKNHYTDDLAESVAAVQSYLDGDITKKNLSKTFTDHNLKRAVTEISTMKTALVLLLADFYEAYNSMGATMETNYEKMFSKTFPFVIDSNKEDYEFLQKMLTWYNDNGGKALIQEYLQLGGKIEKMPFKIELNTNVTENNIWLAIQDSFKGFRQLGMTEEKGLNAFKSDVEKQIASQITQLTNLYDTMFDTMLTYSAAIKMDTTFYK